MVADATPCCLNLCELPFSQSESEQINIYKEKVGSWCALICLFICPVNISLGLAVVHHFCFYGYYRIMGSYWKFNKCFQSSMKSSFVIKVQNAVKDLTEFGAQGLAVKRYGETCWKKQCLIMPHLSPEGGEEVHWREGQEKEQDIRYPGSGRERKV